MNSLHEQSCGNIRHQRKSQDLPASGFYNVAAYNTIERPIAPFHQNIRLESPNKVPGIGCIKNHNMVYAGKRRKDFGSLPFRDKGASRFDASQRGVAIESHHQAVPQRPGLLQKSCMTDMEQIETTVCKHDPFCAISPALKDH